MTSIYRVFYGRSILLIFKAFRFCICSQRFIARNDSPIDVVADHSMTTKVEYHPNSFKIN